MSLKRRDDICYAKASILFPPNFSWNVFTTSFYNEKKRANEKTVSVNVVGATKKFGRKKEHHHGSFVFLQIANNVRNKTKPNQPTKSNKQAMLPK